MSFCISGSEEERAAVRRAFRYSSRREHRVYDVPDPDVSFTLISPDSVTMGDDFILKVTSMITTVCMYISINIVGTSNINDKYCM